MKALLKSFLIRHETLSSPHLPCNPKFAVAIWKEITDSKSRKVQAH